MFFANSHYIKLFALNEHFPGNSVSTSVATQLKLSPVVIGVLESFASIVIGTE